MAHHFSRRAFGQVRTVTPLLECYTSLVAIELALKDAIYKLDPSDWRYTHNIEQLTDHLARKINDRASPAYGKLDDEIKKYVRAIVDLPCTGQAGGPAKVGHEYPNLRYIRHQADFPAGTDDADLFDLRIAIDSLRCALDAYLLLHRLPLVVS